MRFFVILALLFSTVAHAQQPAQPQQDPEFLRNAILAIEMQRNRAMDEAASAEAQLARAQQQLADLKKQLAEKPAEHKK